MVVITYPDSKHVIVILGTGLVGSSILNSVLSNYQFRNSVKWSVTNWNDQKDFYNSLFSIGSENQSEPPSRIDWVWSAGKAGFNSSQSIVDGELVFYKLFLQAVSDVDNLLSNCLTNIHMISSAGGLFEGKPFVTNDTKAEPKRPYGELKLQQELLLNELSFTSSVTIYRISSAYSYLKKGQRAGLITSLISNMQNNRITYIYGRADTLRDYIWAGDIGNFVAGRIMNPLTNGKSTFILASGKPSSIFEIASKIRKFTGRKALIYYKLEKTNLEQITFSPSTRPLGFYPSDLSTCIRSIIRNNYAH
jgi:UDP-glucose 4-epimerase